MSIWTRDPFPRHFLYWPRYSQARTWATKNHVPFNQIRRYDKGWIIGIEV